MSSASASQGGAIQWLYVANSRAMELECREEANREVFERIGRERCNLVSIFGAARQGKSFLMNLLAGQEGVFRISNDRRPCTQGVDLARVTRTVREFSQMDGGGVGVGNVRGSSTRVLFVDAEGQGDRDVTYDARLISPVLLTSKVVIFNWRDSLQKDRILSLLAVAANAAQGVDPEGSGMADEDTLFGHLHIVFRDWNYANGDGAGILRDLMAVERGRGTDVTVRNEARRVLQESFASISVWVLPPPVEATADLARELRFADLQPSFRDGIRQMRAAMARQLLTPMRFNGRDLTGSLVARLVPTLVSHLNSSDDLILPQSVYRAVLERQTQAAAERAVRAVERAAEALAAEAAPLSAAAAVERMEAASRAALADLAAEVDGVPEELQSSSMREVGARVARAREGALRANAARAAQLCNEVGDRAVAAVRDALGRLDPEGDASVEELHASAEAAKAAALERLRRAVGDVCEAADTARQAERVTSEADRLWHELRARHEEHLRTHVAEAAHKALASASERTRLLFDGWLAASRETGPAHPGRHALSHALLRDQHSKVFRSELGKVVEELSGSRRAAAALAAAVQADAATTEEASRKALVPVVDGECVRRWATVLLHVKRAARNLCSRVLEPLLSRGGAIPPLLLRRAVVVLTAAATAPARVFATNWTLPESVAEEATHALGPQLAAPAKDRTAAVRGLEALASAPDAHGELVGDLCSKWEGRNERVLAGAHNTALGAGLAAVADSIASIRARLPVPSEQHLQQLFVSAMGVATAVLADKVREAVEPSLELAGKRGGLEGALLASVASMEESGGSADSKEEGDALLAAARALALDPGLAGERLLADLCQQWGADLEAAARGQHWPALVALNEAMSQTAAQQAAASREVERLRAQARAQMEEAMAAKDAARRQQAAAAAARGGDEEDEEDEDGAGGMDLEDEADEEEEEEPQPAARKGRRASARPTKTTQQRRKSVLDEARAKARADVEARMHAGSTRSALPMFGNDADAGGSSAAAAKPAKSARSKAASSRGRAAKKREEAFVPEDDEDDEDDEGAEEEAAAGRGRGRKGGRAAASKAPKKTRRPRSSAASAAKAAPKRRRRDTMGTDALAGGMEEEEEEEGDDSKGAAEESDEEQAASKPAPRRPRLRAARPATRKGIVGLKIAGLGQPTAAAAASSAADGKELSVLERARLEAQQRTQEQMKANAARAKENQRKVRENHQRRRRR